MHNAMQMDIILIFIIYEMTKFRIAIFILLFHPYILIYSYCILGKFSFNMFKQRAEIHEIY